MKVLWILSLGLLYIIHHSSAAPGTGGLSPLKPADDTASEVVDKVRRDIWAKRCAFLGFKPDSPHCQAAPNSIFEVISYKTQTVAGTNYFVKVRGNLLGKIWHIKVYQPLGDKAPELSSIVGPKELEDDIEYF